MKGLRLDFRSFDTNYEFASKILRKSLDLNALLKNSSTLAVRVKIKNDFLKFLKIFQASLRKVQKF